MGGSGSANRGVSFSLDEDEKVTVIEGVKLSGDVLRRMREPVGPKNSKPPPSDIQRPPSSSKPTGPSGPEMREEIRKSFERQQALLQEHLATLAQKESESVPTTVLGDGTTAFYSERHRADTDKEKAEMLAKQLERKEKQLESLSCFYKEQLETMKKKNIENYQQTAEHFSEAATQAEARIQPRHTGPLCTELQAKVFQCYTENPQQTLLCSSLARQYMACVQQAKSSLTNHG